MVDDRGGVTNDHDRGAIRGDVLLRDALNTARQQGFSGLEAEALFCEATIRPVTNDNERDIVIRCLKASIAIATGSDARPLLVKAQTLLDEMLANSE